MRQLIIIICLFCYILSLADNVKLPESYHYTRFREATLDINLNETVEYSNKQIEENSQNDRGLLALGRNSNKDFKNIRLSTNTEFISYIKEGGGGKVKCLINGLPLYFIFDTGASNVTNSYREATFMNKNNNLFSNNIIGEQIILIANREVNEETVINIRKVKVVDVNLIRSIIKIEHIKSSV